LTAGPGEEAPLLSESNSADSISFLDFFFFATFSLFFSLTGDPTGELAADPSAWHKAPYIFSESATALISYSVPSFIFRLSCLPCFPFQLASHTWLKKPLDSISAAIAAVSSVREASWRPSSWQAPSASEYSINRGMGVNWDAVEFEATAFRGLDRVAKADGDVSRIAAPCALATNKETKASSIEFPRAMQKSGRMPAYKYPLSTGMALVDLITAVAI
jgi:hypothetical protein